MFKMFGHVEAAILLCSANVRTRACQRNSSGSVCRSRKFKLLANTASGWDFMIEANHFLPFPFQ